MSRHAIGSVLFACTLILLIAFPVSALGSDPAFRGYLIKFGDSAHFKNARTAMAKLGVHVESEISQLRLAVVGDNLNLETLRRLRAMAEYVEPNYVRTLSTLPITAPVTIRDAAPEKEASMLSGMTDINAPEAWKINTGSRDIIVAVSDTGIWDHFELTPNIWVNPGESGLDANGKNRAKNKVDDDGNGFKDDVNGWNFCSNTNRIADRHFHGTHVSGTIGAFGGDHTGVAGVAWKTSLMGVPFIDSDGSGTDANAIRSIIYAADNGAKVLNASWGGQGESKPLGEAVEYARQKGMLIVAAAGNDSSDNDKEPSYPAAYPSENIIAVASVSGGDLSWFSNFGPTSVDLGAPGVNIYSTWNPLYSPLYQYYYYEISGTSMAAPHVTGAVALLYSINPKLTWQKVKEIILSSVTTFPHLQGKIVSGGRLNVGEAAKKALATRSE